MAASSRDLALEFITYMNEAQALRPWQHPVDRVVVTGGRLRCGLPLPPSLREFWDEPRIDADAPRYAPIGQGADERYLGADLRTVSAFKDAGVQILLEQQPPQRAPRRTTEGLAGHCGWQLAAAGSLRPATEVMLAPHRRELGWNTVDLELAAKVDGTGSTWRWLQTTAHDGELELQVGFLLRVSEMGQLALGVTWCDLSDPDVQARLMQAQLTELERRHQGSPSERSVRGLLLDGWSQRHKRRRAEERRNFSALVHVVVTALNAAGMGTPSMP